MLASQRYIDSWSKDTCRLYCFLIKYSRGDTKVASQRYIDSWSKDTCRFYCSLIKQRIYYGSQLEIHRQLEQGYSQNLLFPHKVEDIQYYGSQLEIHRQLEQGFLQIVLLPHKIQWRRYKGSQLEIYRQLEQGYLQILLLPTKRCLFKLVRPQKGQKFRVQDKISG